MAKSVNVTNVTTPTGQPRRPRYKPGWHEWQLEQSEVVVNKYGVEIPIAEIETMTEIDTMFNYISDSIGYSKYDQLYYDKNELMVALQNRRQDLADISLRQKIGKKKIKTAVPTVDFASVASDTLSINSTPPTQPFN